jgi:glycosyltransferase involved in cell wall biosynthesis
MKIAIYTIAKNESHNVRAFIESAEGCPVYILDTGSTDDTVNLAKSYGAVVDQQIISPWRFDVARQLALDMVSDDIDLCVSVDMDERLEPGWQNTAKTRMASRSKFWQLQIHW